MASASFTGIDQSPVKITCVVAFGLASLRAEREGVDIAQHLRNGLGRDKAQLAGLGGIASHDAGDVLRFVDVAEVAAGVLGILVLHSPPQCSKRSFGKLLRQLDHVRIVVAKRRRKDQRRAVEIDHVLDRLLDGVGLGDFLFFDDLDARQLLQCGGALRMGLVVAVVVA